MVCCEEVVQSGAGCTQVFAFGNVCAEVIESGIVSVGFWFVGKGVVAIMADGTVCIGLLLFTGCVGVSQDTMVCLGVSQIGKD